MSNKNIKDITLNIIEKINQNKLSNDDYLAITKNESLNYSLLTELIKNKDSSNSISDQSVKYLMSDRIENHLTFINLILSICIIHRLDDLLLKLPFKKYKKEYQDALIFLNKKEDIYYLLEVLKNKNLNSMVFNYFLGKNEEICSYIKKEFKLNEQVVFTDNLKLYDEQYYSLLLKNKNKEFNFLDLLNNKELFMSNLSLVNKLSTENQKIIYKKYMTEILENETLYNLLNKDFIFDVLSLFKQNEKIVREIIKKEKNIRNEHVILVYKYYNAELTEFLNIEKIQDVEKAILCTFNSGEKSEEILCKILNKFNLEEDFLVKILKNIQKSNVTKYTNLMLLLVSLVKNKDKIKIVLIENESLCLNFIKEIEINKVIADKLLVNIFQNNKIDVNNAIELVNKYMLKNIKINWKKVFEDMYYKNTELLKYIIQKDTSVLKQKYLINFYDNKELLLEFFNKKDFSLKESYLKENNEYIFKKKKSVYELYQEFKNIRNF